MLIMTTTHMSTAMPAHIILDKWADIGFLWQGDVHLDTLPRLAEELYTTDDIAPLHIVVRLYKENGILYLSYDIKGALPLTCLRCLSPLNHNITGSYRTALVTDERQLSMVDGDYIFIAELDTDGRLPIRDLLEDELLLALPISIHHNDCQMFVDSVGKIPEDEPKTNPFAALATLKGKN